MKVKKKVLVVCSYGGHFDAAVAILPSFHDCTVEMVSYRALGLKDLSRLNVEKLYFVSLFGATFGIKLAISMLVNMFEFVHILFRSRPNIIFSTGAEISLPLFFIAMFIPGIILIHLETATRPNQLSLSGRILRPICHTFFVQWPGLEKKIKNVKFSGRVF